MIRKLFTRRKKKKTSNKSIPLTGIERAAIDNLSPRLLSLRAEMGDREFQLRTRDIDYDNVERVDKAIANVYGRR